MKSWNESARQRIIKFGSALTKTYIKERNDNMEERNMIRNMEELKEIKEELEEVLNIMQLLEISLAENEDDGHIIRSLHVLQRMVKSVMDKVGKYID